ncbi:hypothetical protein BpHYR1_019609 [Brachionus plicatilis]|uniref:Uncharacterized protein n=1 Tax=Brachionus plicatilis TaxID=10195 RepID=A0A3M7Q3V2_BRAPC|nr:hypothetical protein BpHYR1_019609 [Brachionus plicatilis]
MNKKGWLIIFTNINKFSISQVKFDYSLKRDNSLIVKADELILSDFSMIDSLSAYRIVNNENKYYVDQLNQTNGGFIKELIYFSKTFLL